MSTDSGPAVRKSRTLILCFDGTSNQYDSENTNVVKFYSVLKKNDTDQQLCYYQPGIGTYFQPGVVQPLFQWGAKMLDEAVAWYLDAHVQGGYTFLMQNYCAGDRICIFGFSRGAYTARALAGMLHKIGLLPKDNPEQVPLAYKLFQNSSKDSRLLAAGFKSTFCRAVSIDFVGVWDTVASVGLLRSKTLPFTTTNTTIRVFRHALALDERRAKFQPNLYHRLSPDASVTVPDLQVLQEPAPEKAPEVLVESPVQPVNSESSAPLAPREQPKKKQGVIRRVLTNLVKTARKGNPLRGDNIVSPAADPADDYVGQTDVKEVWFVGCHGDVGGGSVPNATRDALADVPLRWMIRQVEEAQVGVVFESEALRALRIPEPTLFAEPVPVGREHGQKGLEEYGVRGAGARASEESEGGRSAATDRSAVDALMPIHDQLKADPVWWILEVIPTNYTYQDARGVWHSKWSLHLGRGRSIPSRRPLFHVTVKERMDKVGYRPRATWREGEEEYVE